MAQLAIAAAGAAIGGGAAGFLGIGIGTGLSVGWSVGSFLGGQLFPTEIKTKGPRLNDLRVSASTYGIKVPQIYSTIRVPTNMIWSTGIKEKKKTTSAGGGLFGKGGGGGVSQTLTTYSYSLTSAYGIAEPIDTVLRIWANKKVIYDSRADIKLKKKYKKMEITIYNGAEDQLPPPEMQAQEGVALTPAYRGVSYVMIKDLPLEDFGNAQPQIEVEAVRNSSIAHFLERVEDGVAGVEGYSHQTFVDRDRLVMYALMSQDGTSRIGKFDLLSNTQMLVSGNESPDFLRAYGVDDNGVVVAKYNASVALVDPLTLTVLNSSIATIGSAHAIFVDNVSDLGNIWTFNIAVLGGGDFLVRCFNNTLGLVGSADTVGLGYGRVRRIEAVDFLGNAWTMTFTSQMLKIPPSGDMTGFDLSGTFTPSNNPPHCSYDSATNSVLIGAGNTIYKWSVEDEAVVDQVIIPGVQFNAGINSINGKQWFSVRAGGGDSYFAEFNIATMEVERTYLWSSIPNAFISPSFGYLNAIYIPDTHSIVSTWQTGLTDFGFDQIYLDRLVPANMLLSQVVDEICTGRPEAFLYGAGLKDADIDVTELIDEVDGYVSSKHDPGRALIEQLRLAYFFDGVESDGEIKWLKRGRDPVVTIPDEDLAAHERGQELPDLITTTRGQETELPRRVNVKYMDKENDYQDGLQYSPRLITEAVGEFDAELPMVLFADHARAISDVLMYEQWAARNTREARVSNEYAYLDPADPIEIEQLEEIAFVSDAPPELPLPEEPPEETVGAEGDYYVATDGSDSNPGTEAEPKLTIAAGIALLSAGDTLIVKNGTYNERIWKQIPSGTSGAYTMVQAETPLGVTLQPPGSGDDSTDFGVWIYDADYIVLDGFVIDGVNLDNKGMLLGASNSTDTNLGSHIVVRNCEIKNVPGSSQPGTGNGINTGRSTFVTISNCTVHDCGSVDPSHGIYLTGANNLVEDCEVYNIGDHGIHQFHQGSSTDSNNIVRNNYIHDCGSRGIIIGSGDNNVAHHNIIANCGTDHATDGIRVDAGGPANCKVYNNTIYSQNGIAITVSASCQFTQVKNNLCLSNSNNIIAIHEANASSIANLLSTNLALVVDAPGGDFTPRPGSALIDAGVDVGLSFNGAAPDIGAVES